MNCLGRLRLITFDVTNTLVQFRTSRVKQYGEIGALFGVRCDNNDLAKNFKANWLKMNDNYPNFGRTSNMNWKQWWHQLIEGTFSDSGAKIPVEKLEDFSLHLINLYKTSVCWEHCNNSLELLKYLSKLQHASNNSDRPSFIMGVISNFDPRLDTLLRNMKINHFFQFALNSYDSQVEKPNKIIFQMAMEASQLKDLKPNECFHIGDGPTTDYIGAKEAGWHAALVHEKNADYLTNKYGDRINSKSVYPSLYDFHKRLLNNDIHL